MIEQIFQAYDLPKETVTAIMIINKITTVKVCSPDGNIDFFDIVNWITMKKKSGDHLRTTYVNTGLLFPLN